MPQDIRSFFTVISKKPAQSSSTTTTTTKKRLKPVDSDDDVISPTPEKHEKNKKRKLVVLSDSEDEDFSSKPDKIKNKSDTSKKNEKLHTSNEKKTKTPDKNNKEKTKGNESKTNKQATQSGESSSKTVERINNDKKKTETLKPVNIVDIFGAEPVKQTKVEKVNKPETVDKVTTQKGSKSKKKESKKDGKKNASRDDSFKRLETELGIHDDDDFEKTLIELDEKILAEEAINSHEKRLVENSSLVNDSSFVEDTSHVGDTSHVRDISQAKDISQAEDSLMEIDSSIVQTSFRKEIETNRKGSSSSEGKTPGKKRKHEESHDDSIDPDQERYEKKRYSAALYQKFLQRGGPEHHGMKEIPKGKPNCLNNLCFLRTGVLDSLENDEFESLIKEHGGRTVHAVSKKVNYVVAGREPGPAKMEKAQSYGINIINEDELLDLILVKSGNKPKYTKNDGDSIQSPEKVDKNSKERKLKSPSETKNSPSKSKNSSSKTSSSPSKNTNPPSKVSPKKQEEISKSKINLKKLSERPKESGEESKDVKLIKSKELKLKESKEINIKECNEVKKKEISNSEDEIPTETNKNGLQSSSFYGKRSVEKLSNKSPENKIKSPRKDSRSSRLENFASPVKDTNIKVNKELKLSAFDTEKGSTSAEDAQKKSETPKVNLAWCEKYKPTSTSQIIGQQGENSNMKKLMYWLKNWHNNHSGPNKPKVAKPTPWAKNNDGAWYKAALLSGPPGVGKTTTATLVSKELGFDVVEFNASDTRSKKLLHEEVSQLLSSTSLASFIKDGSAPTRKHVLLMDEVDGMAGNEDRGGMQELINLIKKSNVPIICMCNDRNHQKVRSLANYCFDLRFSKPKLEQIRGVMMSVCCKEGVKMKPDALSQVINGAGMDIRQIFNHLSVWTAADKTLDAEQAQKEAKAAKKDIVLGPWEVCRKVFSKEEHKTMSIADKSRLFFYDYSLNPLFIQENYLQAVPDCPRNEVLDRFAKASESLSSSDLIDKKIRSSNNWSLLETQAMYSSVLPGFYLEGHLGGQINFPGWLGKNSRKTKFTRLLCDLHSHMRTSISGSRQAINLDYLTHIRNSIVQPLVKEGMGGIKRALEVMSAYNLTREDFDSILELSLWTGHKDPMAMVETKVKAAFTRNYNKDGPKLPYAVVAGTFKKRAAALQNEDEYGEEEVDDMEEDDDDINNDAMIKEKKKPAVSSRGKKESEAKPSTSKKGGSSKGKGKK